jgi:dUTP pyrophosphatase
MKLKITRIEKDLPLPVYKTPGSVAFDVYTRVDMTIDPKSTAIVPTNLIIEVPEGYFLLLASRSSTAKKGLLQPNGIGVIDQDFHGPQDEIGAFVHNSTDQQVELKRGDRIAQGLIIPIQKVEWEEVDAIKAESRGGFGSTGVK